VNLSGKNILLTGGTSGLGLETAAILASEGAYVTALGRTLKGSFPESPNYRFLATDFSDLEEVRRTLYLMKGEGIRFDIVINNAGVLTSPDYIVTSQGNEYSFQVNFLSHLLVNEFILREGMYNENPLVMVVTSPVYRLTGPGYVFPERAGFKAFRTYSETKYYLLLIGDFLRKRYPSSGLSFAAFDPGTFGSGICRMQHRWFRIMYAIGNVVLKSPAKVASRLCEVLERGEYGFNTVFSVHGHQRVFSPAEPGNADRFMEECFTRIA